MNDLYVDVMNVAERLGREHMGHSILLHPPSELQAIFYRHDGALHCGICFAWDVKYSRYDVGDYEEMFATTGPDVRTALSDALDLMRCAGGVWSRLYHTLRVDELRD